MPRKSLFSKETLPSDLKAGLVVFLVALPLCLGVALLCKAPLFSGVLSGILGGIIVGALSKSHTSVSGPSPALAAVVAAQIVTLGSFQAFLVAVVIAGAIQVVIGVIRAGSVAAFFPSSVINGLIVAVGIILVLKQVPHVVGHDTDPEGDSAFFQPDEHNTLSELAYILDDFNLPAAGIGLVSIALLVFWDRNKRLKNSMFPGQLVVVVFGIAANYLFQWLTNMHGKGWQIEASHLVQVPVAKSVSEFFSFLTMPDFSVITNSAVWLGGATIAIVACLETLLNIEAVDKIDPQRRESPPNRELIAQGIGNMTAGLIGGLPITSVIVRSSVNMNAGAKTRMATIFHGLLMVACVALLPTYLNMIPISCLAAILTVTGFKLASPQTIRRMWKEGRKQFLPFVVTVVAIVFTDLLIGILIGLVVAIGFILQGNLHRPLVRIREKHIGGEIMRIKLSSQVSFLNRAALAQAFAEVPEQGHLLIDAHNTHYIDPDVLNLIHDFTENVAPTRGIRVSLRGFLDKYAMKDRIEYIDYSTRELQQELTPGQVLQILKDGNQRFIEGKPLHRNTSRNVDATSRGQFPLAAILSRIDVRTPAEIVFDLGLGDIFSVRTVVVVEEKVLGSLEYALPWPSEADFAHGAHPMRSRQHRRHARHPGKDRGGSHRLRPHDHLLHEIQLIDEGDAESSARCRKALPTSRMR
ncbi:MAG: SulP family inorganic anion transporter [Gemmataceae bacterium]